MKISVVVPCFNSEKYIADTLNNLLCQTLGDIEIIAVDDGSTDSTGKILTSYALEDRRVKIITGENRGVSAARNLGLTRAVGDYVIFQDSDDLFSADALENFYKRMVETGADVGISRLMVFGDGKEEFNPYAEELSREETISPYDKKLLWSFMVGNKCYRRARLIDFGTDFPAFKYAEEGAFFIKYCLETAPKITGVPGAVMKYRRHSAGEELSVSQQISRELFLNFCDSLERIYNCACACPLPEREREDYLNEVLYKAAHILIMQFYRLMWQTDEETLAIIGTKYREICGKMNGKTMRRTLQLSSDIGPLLFTHEDIASSPRITAVVKSPTQRFLDAAYSQTMPCFRILACGTAPQSAKKRKNFILCSTPASLKKQADASSSITVRFKGNSAPDKRLFKVICILHEKDIFSALPGPLLKLAAKALIFLKDIKQKI